MARHRTRLRFSVDAHTEDKELAKLAKEIVLRLHGDCAITIEVSGTRDDDPSEYAQWVAQKILSLLDRYVRAGKLSAADLKLVEFC
jgi:hypothetical protein